MRAGWKKLRRSWLLWLAVSLFWSLYIWGGYVASRTVTAEMKLDPGASFTVDVLRLADDELKMELVFRGDHVRRRLELGEWVLKASEMNSGFLKFATPGAPIRLAASVPHADPVAYEAMPTSGHSSGTAYRDLTSDLSGEPGVWRWPPHYNDLVLHRGHNAVKIDVLSVGAPLVGETVELMVHPALGFLVVNNANAASWLWPWFLWPVIIAIQLTWAIVLVVRNRSTAR